MSKLKFNKYGIRICKKMSYKDLQIYDVKYLQNVFREIVRGISLKIGTFGVSMNFITM